MMPRWLKGLHKVCDIVLEICVGQKYWGALCHEPLMIGICFPFSSKPPWQLRNMPVFLKLSRMMRAKWKERDPCAGNVLRQTLLQVSRLDQRSDGEVKKLLNGGVGEFLSYRKQRKRKAEVMEI